MEVILLEKITNLGVLGDTVSVASGYGRNYLVPYGKAVPATKANLESFAEKREELERKAAGIFGEAKHKAQIIDNFQLKMMARASEEGKLFGSIGAKDVAEAITSAVGVEIIKKEIRFSDGIIREIGEYDVRVQLHTDVFATVKVCVEASTV